MNVLLMLLGLILVGCSDAEFAEVSTSQSLGKVSDSGDLPNVPEPRTPGVAGNVTILLTIGDLHNNNLVIKHDSAIAIAENAVSYASAVKRPKILLIKDHNHHNESSNDTEFLKLLLQNYDVLAYEETEEGIGIKDLEGFDLVWFNNPGHPFGSQATYNALLQFKGGVILSGDDLTRGKGFDTSELTGLRYINNGTSVRCNGRKFRIDNNKGHQYEVTIVAEFFEGIEQEHLSFHNGNDIDLSELVSPDAEGQEVLAYAVPDIEACPDVGPRPVIVRSPKNFDTQAIPQNDIAN